MPRLPSIASLGLALAACDAAPPDRVANSAGAVNAYAARVAALPAGQRNGVLIRAIRDADRECQQVTESKAAGEVAGEPAWSAVCDGRTAWIVAFGSDGIASVIAAPPKP